MTYFNVRYKLFIILMFVLVRCEVCFQLRDVSKHRRHILLYYKHDQIIIANVNSILSNIRSVRKDFQHQKCLFSAAKYVLIPLMTLFVVNSFLDLRIHFQHFTNCFPQMKASQIPEHFSDLWTSCNSDH